jgi:hypothetical protein
MGRQAKGPRLYLQPARRDQYGAVLEAPVWVIRDGSIKRSTGCAENQRELAEVALADYARGRAPDKTYYVYFLSAKSENFPVKIGITETRAGRFRSIQSALPFEVEVIGMVPVKDPIFERRLHRQFAGSRLQGEWFTRSPELLAAIEKLTAENLGA